MSNIENKDQAPDPEYFFRLGPPPTNIVFLGIPNHSAEPGEAPTTITHGLSHATARRLFIELRDCLDADLPSVDDVIGIYKR